MLLTVDEFTLLLDVVFFLPSYDFRYLVGHPLTTHFDAVVKSRSKKRDSDLDRRMCLYPVIFSADLFTSRLDLLLMQGSTFVKANLLGEKVIDLGTTWSSCDCISLY